jgi:PKHD-type hydroxylase
MLLHIPNMLSAAELARCRKALEGAEWSDGRMTAGYLSSRVKNNEQLAENSPVARQLGETILDALDRNQLFVSAALPLKVVPPLFNRYAGGQAYGGHIDGAVRPVAGTPHRVRTDLSATLFLCEPAEYDGGELAIDDKFGMRRIKLAAGDMVLYPGTSVHHVEPVTRGVRLAAFFWVQSMVRDGTQRDILFEIDTALQRLGRDVPDHPSLVQLAGAYHNLLRQWSDT